jgi:hypothetical protein
VRAATRARLVYLRPHTGHPADDTPGSGGASSRYSR